MKSKNTLRNDGLISPQKPKKNKKLNTVKRIQRQDSGLIERCGEKILTEDGKELLKEN